MPTRPTLYVSRLLPEPVMTALAERFRLVGIPASWPPTRTDLHRELRDAEFALVTLTERMDEDVLRDATRLRVISNYAVGYNNIDLALARARGLVVTNTPDVLTETTADLAWALLLATARRIVEGHELVAAGAWTGWEPTQLLGTDVHGQTLGIVGMGRIGRSVARRAAGFMMRVLYAPRHPGGPPQAGTPGDPVPLDELLRRSDFITLHVPLTAETHHLIGEAAFRLMRPTAILINTSRGPVVDEAALLRALTEGRLAGAGLDVYEREPHVLPGLRASRLVTLLPHLGSATLATRIRMGMVCRDNLIAVLEGRAAPNRVA